MRSIILPVSMLIAVFCCAATDSTETTSAYVIGFEDREILDAYKHSDVQRLNSFFQRWQLQSREISEAELKVSPRHIRTLYEIFEAFYCDYRNQIEKRMAASVAAQAESQDKGRESSQPKPAEKQEYLVIQNEIRLVVLAKDEYESRRKSVGYAHLDMSELRNFRPRISSGMGRKVLYLDKTHNSALNYFFNETDGDSPACPDYNESKEAFLAEKMLLHHYHWGRGYHYISFPQVYTVALNSDMDKAYIVYRDRWNGGGSSECQRRDGTWEMAKRHSVWRE